MRAATMLDNYPDKGMSRMESMRSFGSGDGAAPGGFTRKMS